MSLDESLFHRMHRWWTGARRRRSEANELDLAATQPRMRRLLAILLGQQVELAIGEGHSRVGQRIVLPPRLPLGPAAGDAEAVVTLQLALAAAAHTLSRSDQRFAPFAQPAPPEHAHAAMRDAMPSMLSWLDNEWPSARSLMPTAERYRNHIEVQLGRSDSAQLRAHRITYGRLPLRALPAEPKPTAGPPAPAESLPSGSEHERKRKNDIEIVEVNEEDDGQNPLAHVLEKVKTAEEHTAGNRSIDGSDELEAHLEALEELDLNKVIRSRTRTTSVFRADADFESATGDLVDDSPPPAETYLYDEWDEHKRNYLQGWCGVGETTTASAEPETFANQLGAIRAKHGATIRQVRAEFARLLRGNSIMRRQPLGTDIDIDAVVDRHGDLIAARHQGAIQGEPRLYIARRPAAQEVAVTILFDRSLSSDSWVAGRRILDTTRQAIVLLGEALRGVRLPVSVAAFCSHTRRNCRYDVIKNFRESWQAMASRLFAIAPDGYTRIGPALRHAAFRLGSQPARRRLLLVISDCKPVDYDHYEGRRGIGDVRQAVREARRGGIETLALAVDKRAGDHLPGMFGKRGFRVLTDARSLARALARLHERLLRN